MKLDDTVCRGSLIIYEGKSLVVVGPLRVMDHKRTAKGGTSFSLVNGFKTCVVENFNGELEYVVDGQGIPCDVDVDTFFPGAVFELPDYLV